MATTWYLTKYARLSDGGLELVCYAAMPNFAVAQHRAKTQLPNNEFYLAECKVGSLLAPTPKPSWVARDRYSHKPHIARLQVEAELKAQHILNILVADTFDVKNVLSEMQLLKPILTKPQYQILLDTLMSKPKIINILYERSNAQ